MIDQLLGSLLFALGVVKNTYPRVLGDESVATAPATSTKSGIFAPVLPGDADKESLLRRLEVLEAMRKREQTLKELFDTRRINQEKALVDAKNAALQRDLERKKLFAQKVSTFRSAQKKQAAASVNNRLSEFNAQRTKVLLSYVIKMQDVLDKVSARAAVAKSAGKDVSRVESAVTAAQAAVASALTAVNTQAGKNYVATVTSEETVKTDMEQVKKQLQDDIHTVMRYVDAARKAVHAAVAALGTVMGEKVDADLQSTPSATPKAL